jgi:hypothetical protein
MNNNNIYNNNNFIGTIHQDILKNTSNILSKQIINTSNILTNQITNTSNNLTNQINRINTDNSNYTLQIGNIVENNSIIYTNQLRYDVNKLINEEFEHISFPIPYDTHHTYVYNSNIGGDIRFYTESTKYYPIPFPSGEPPYRVKIDSSGKLFLYYTYDPFINATGLRVRLRTPTARPPGRRRLGLGLRLPAGSPSRRSLADSDSETQPGRLRA